MKDLYQFNKESESRYTRYREVRSILFDTDSDHSLDCVTLYLMDIIVDISFNEEKTVSMDSTLSMLRHYLGDLVSSRSMSKEHALVVLNFAQSLLGVTEDAELTPSTKINNSDS